MFEGGYLITVPLDGREEKNVRVLARRQLTLKRADIGEVAAVSEGESIFACSSDSPVHSFTLSFRILPGQFSNRPTS
jgi:hypothetical protein